MDKLNKYLDDISMHFSPKFIRPAHRDPRIEDSLQDEISYFYRNRNLMCFMDGYFWMSDPSYALGLFDGFFPSRLNVRSADLRLIGYTSLSTLYVLEAGRRLFRVDLNHSDVVIIDDPKIFSRSAEGLTDKEVLIALGLTYWIEDDLALHRSAVSRIGALREGEVYGYFPALQFGGSRDPVFLRRVSAVEHWWFLKCLDDFPCHQLRLV